jgi:riboflavin synthase
MFSGIIAAVGRIETIEQRSKGLHLRIAANGLDLGDIAVGDSIAVNGVCLTAVNVDKTHFEADVSAETLSCTVGLDKQAEVNLEKALRLSDRLGGHLVSGHVDGVGEVLCFEAVGESYLLRIRVPQALAKFIARKGSVAVQGVSLTVNKVAGAEFDINLTTLKNLQPGAQVNLEIDQVARYVERMLGGDAS